MPKHAKATKSRRDRGMIKGLRKHRDAVGRNTAPGAPTVDALIARFQEHLDAMAAVDQQEAAWRAAIARETRLEGGIKTLMMRVKPLIEGTFGTDACRFRSS